VPVDVPVDVPIDAPVDVPLGVPVDVLGQASANLPTDATAGAPAVRQATAGCRGAADTAAMQPPCPSPFDFSRLVLDTPRLRLRPLQPDDAPAVFALHADARAMRHWSTPPWTDPAWADALVADDLRALPQGDWLRLALVRQADGQLVGLCSLFAFLLASRRAELGYLLHPDAWGQGLMHEALCALLGHGFAALGLHRVEADIDPANTASARTLQRLGFRQEGLLRERWIVDGRVSDSALYGLLRADWPAVPARPAAGRAVRG
jgi:RimJ/RimL family protein N-acetyltransferase